MPQGLFDLHGRVAVVTGGCGILGVKHAEVLASYGAHVAIADLESDRCAQVAADLTARYGPQALGTQLDVTCKESVQSMVDRILSKYDRLDILVNNAATKTERFFAPFEEFPLKDWQQVMNVNITGMFLCAQAVCVPMLKQRAGTIINIASIYGLVGSDTRVYEGSEHQGRAINTPAVYSASKGAVISFTRYLATYFGNKGIRVNAITPGGISSGQNERFVHQYSMRTPLGRMGSQTELQGAVVYLASDASSYVTGHNLVVDGGWTAW